MTKILCDITSCVYYIFYPKAGDAYKHQCENDEIEISLNNAGKPECFSYEKMRNDERPIWYR
jgi:hypothetical protein